jgi:hypothetical protein
MTKTTDTLPTPSDLTRSHEIATSFDEFFAAFIKEVLDTQPPDSCRGTSSIPECADFSKETEISWRDQTLACMNHAGPAYKSYRDVQHRRLADAMNRVATDATHEAIGSFVSANIEIVSDKEFSPTAGCDFYYVKINHGYWEQLLALFCEPSRVAMRILDTEIYKSQYISSGFMDAVDVAIRRAASDDGSVIRFPHIHFGVSLWNGRSEHADVLADVPSEAFLHQIVLGASIGVKACFDSLFGQRHLSFCDGSFPKHGLKTGLLHECLHSFAAEADLVIFVIPPHLKGIRIAGTNVPHEHMFISGSMVHESWIASLYFTVGQILQRVAVNGRVLVITQSAVFSALLGLFLQSAKNAVVPRGTIYFFDLGQVIDIANPLAGGHWAKNYAPAHKTLFTLGEEGASPTI